ncbi:flippase [Virgibacillus sp. JSM 102003]|uniref:flippase n=1 Tax=Virgibacillus sp. JSM 102003 TaxID=1562108 RepID=UPI0035BF97C6
MNKELGNVTKQSGLVFMGKIVGLLIGLLFNIVAARFLGAEIYGEFMYIFTFISFFPILALFGLQQGLVYFIPKYNETGKNEERNSIITFSFLLVFLFSSIIVLLIYCNSEYIAGKLLNNPDLNHLVKLMSPLLIFMALSQLSQGVFRGTNKIKYYVTNQELLAPLLKIFVLLVTLFIGGEYYSLPFAYYTGVIIGTIYLVIIIYKLRLFGKLSLLKLSKYKELFRFSLPLLFTGYLGLISQKSDLLMIGYFLGEGQVGIYSIALKIGTLSSFILVAFNTMFAPTISSLYHKNDMNSLLNLYKVFTKWIVLVNLVAFSLILIFSESIMKLFGESYIEGSLALVLVSIGQVVNAGVGSAGYIIIMTGNSKQAMYINIISVVVNVSLNIMLIPEFGIEGAAFSSLVSVVIVNILRLLLVYKNHNMHPYNFSYIKVLLAIVIASTFIGLLNYWLNIYWLVQLTGLICLFLIIFSVIYYLLGLSKEDKMILNTLSKKLIRKEVIK